MPSTKERLAEELRKCAKADPERADHFEAMAIRAEVGVFDDYESKSVTPIGDLVRELQNIGTRDAMWLRRRAIRGDFDGTQEEAAAWMKRSGFV